TWVQQIITANIPLSDYLLREKGIAFIHTLGIKEEDLSFSSGWDEVSDITIKNCWNSTSILPDAINNPEAARLKKDLELYYTTVDEPLATKDVINDDEILAMVYETFNPKQVVTDPEEDDMPPTPLVNLSEAINALNILIQFQEQRENNNKFKPEELDMLRKKVYQFEKLKNVSKKQTNLFGYFGDQDSQHLFERFMEIKKVLALRGETAYKYCSPYLLLLLKFHSNHDIYESVSKYQRG
ncbi:22601_t:CDS:2, partial [Racocetra persica]